jgi:hypothetical protein
MLFAQLAFARLLKTLIDSTGGITEKVLWKNVKIIFIAALAIGTITQFYMIGKVYLPQWMEFTPHVRMKTYEHPQRKYIALKPYLHRGDIVLTDISTSWILPCITDVKVISLLHNVPRFLENFERMKDTMNFFNSPKEQISILKKYRVSHILVNKTTIPKSASDSEIAHRFKPYPGEQLFTALSELGNVIINDKNFFLVEVQNLY